MKFFEEMYLDVLTHILYDGYEVKNDRTGVGTIMATNQLLEADDVENTFPLLITKKLALKSIIGELLWFMEGSTSDRRLAEITYGDGDHRTIWTANWEAKPYRSPTTHSSVATDFNGPRELGPVYGRQWRAFGSPNRKWSGDRSKAVDQLIEVIERIKTMPHDRRLFVSAWNPTQISQMALPPCHVSFQFNVFHDRLDLLMTQRSGDMFLGVPFNMASYALLLKIVAAETGYKAGKVSIIIGNAHIYSNHIEQVKEQINRRYSNEFQMAAASFYSAANEVRGPQILLNKRSHLFKEDGSISYEMSDFTVANYNPLPAIKGDMAV